MRIREMDLTQGDWPDFEVGRDRMDNGPDPCTHR